MSSSKIAAIAILAMVVIPIGLGYVLSFEEVEKEGWRTDKQYNLTDSLLNSSTPYYAKSTAPINNGMLLDGFNIVSPVYSSVTSVPSSLPVFEPSTVNVADSSFWPVASGTVNATTLAFNDGVLTVSGGTTSLQSSAYVVYRVTLSAGLTVYADGSQVSTGTSFIISKVVVGSDIQYKVAKIASATSVTSVTSSAVDTVTLTAASASNISLSYMAATEISADYFTLRAVVPTVAPFNFAFLGVEIVTLDDRINVTEVAGSLRVVGSGSIVTISAPGLNETISGVVSVNYYKFGGTVRLSTTSPSGGYADPAEGWTLPAVEDTNNQTAGTWSNGVQNESITMYVNMGTLLGDAGVTIGIWDSWYAPDNYDVLSIGTSLTFNGARVPNFSLIPVDALQLIFTVDTVTVSIIDGMPSMYSDPTTYGSVTLDRSYPGQIFALDMAATDYIGGIPGGSFQKFKFRVDSTEIYAGTYPVTENIAVDTSDKFGGGAMPYLMQFTSIGVYGDALQIAGNSYPVTDGSITVNGTTYRLLNLKISVVPGDGNFIVSLNGSEEITATSYPSVYFSGVWSLTVILWTVETYTDTGLEWVAGSWAFWDDFDVLPLVGILSAVGVFIALAMCRPFSAGKIVMLAIICGCGILFYMVFI